MHFSFRGSPWQAIQVSLKRLSAKHFLILAIVLNTIFVLKTLLRSCKKNMVNSVNSAKDLNQAQAKMDPLTKPWTE